MLKPPPPPLMLIHLPQHFCGHGEHGVKQNWFWNGIAENILNSNLFLQILLKDVILDRYKSSMSSVKFPSYLGAIKLSEEYPGVFTKDSTNSGGGGDSGGDGGGDSRSGGDGGSDRSFDGGSVKDDVKAKATQSYWKGKFESLDLLYSKPFIVNCFLYKQQ